MHTNTKPHRAGLFLAGVLFMPCLGCLYTVAAQGRDVERKVDAPNTSAAQDGSKGVERKTEGRDTIPPQDGSKGMKPDEAGVKTNPKRKRETPPSTLRTPKRFTRKPAAAGKEFAQVGVTIWRIDAGQSKGIEQVGEEQTIERLDTNALYTSRETIRLRIQSPTAGYLYIVDQEQYADGSYGPATLVFPTLTTRKGNNLIESWTAIEVPAYPSVWRFKPREIKAGEVRKVQTAEVLTIIISPKPLVDVSRISEKQLALNKGEFEGWLTKWKTPIQQFDMENSVGQIGRSKGIEQEGEEASAEEEVGGQTTYQVAIRPGDPILVSLPLRFKTAP